MNVRLRKHTRQAAAVGKFNRCGADDNSPYAQEPDEAKVSCPVLYRRWGGQPPHRPELGRLWPGFRGYQNAISGLVLTWIVITKTHVINNFRMILWHCST